ncbi:hypothetical protein [Streptomyces sp. NPDC051219]|uniref:hypothetical protein n=1 Tax=Streptomyces sp. NPDC051219 TaxID=3155283 RepID=UPI003415CA9B
MDLYRGEVTVIVGHVEYTGEADLHEEVDRGRIRTMGTPSIVDGLISWGGTLVVRDEDAAGSIRQADVCRLRLRDGREGTFVVREDNPGALHLVIIGSGPSPY